VPARWFFPRASWPQLWQSAATVLACFHPRGFGKLRADDRAATRRTELRAFTHTVRCRRGYEIARPSLEAQAEYRGEGLRDQRATPARRSTMRLCAAGIGPGPVCADNKRESKNCSAEMVATIPTRSAWVSTSSASLKARVPARRLRDYSKVSKSHCCWTCSPTCHPCPCGVGKAPSRARHTLPRLRFLYAMWSEADRGTYSASAEGS
jgi:hypothetical protein